MIFNRLIFNEILSRLQEPRHTIQVLAGPRQVGKTTLVLQLLEQWQLPKHYASADTAGSAGSVWIEQQWQVARLQMQQTGAKTGVLVLDEIQKVHQWSSIVKQLWDEDTANKLQLYVILLGSAQLLLQQGLSESLAGRFEIIPITHWSFVEMHEAFNCNLSDYIYFGGYPGAYALHQDEMRWMNYVNDALIETTVSRDILQMVKIEKPALLRRLFDLACHYSGQILSYQKMTGQLQDVGNTTTLAHYLQLLQQAGLVCGIDKFANQAVRKRASSPKLQVFNTALLTAILRQTKTNVQTNPELWGRWVESAVGAYLLNSAIGTGVTVTYWRERQHEVDFILQHGENLVAIEVKSGRINSSLSGMQQFKKQYPQAKCLLIGSGGISLEMFFAISPAELFGSLGLN